MHDDVEGALKKARAEGKAVLVDAWAPWCHTCLSMKSYVLPDPSLAPLADRVVLVAIDTDRPENAGFLEKYAINVWPTFFVLDPAGQVLGYWPGSASARELKQFLEESLAALDDTRAAKMPEGSPDRELLAAKAAQASRAYDKAARAYARAVEKAPATWARRSEALVGWIFALYGSRSWDECARVGRAHAGEVTGAAMPADYSSMLLACASKLPPGEAQAEARKAAVAKLRVITEKPPADASADDRADALAILAGALMDGGDVEGARKANVARVAVMEAAAKAAPTPQAAATYDYARAGAYVALGRADDAVKMLEQREREMPDSYEPPARLAGVLSKIDRLPEALAAIDRAIKRAYGPRKLQYLKLKSDILARMGDSKGQVDALREEVAGHEALAKGHADKERLADAKRRLADAEKAAKTAAKPNK
jgi:thiol-disulfide isomerase/thioredoxin